MFGVVSLVVAVFGAGLEVAAKEGPGQMKGQGSTGGGQVCQKTTDLAGAVDDQVTGPFGMIVVAAVTAR